MSLLELKRRLIARGVACGAVSLGREVELYAITRQAKDVRHANDVSGPLRRANRGGARSAPRGVAGALDDASGAHPSNDVGRELARRLPASGAGKKCGIDEQDEVRLDLERRSQRSRIGGCLIGRRQRGRLQTSPTVRCVAAALRG